MVLCEFFFPAHSPMKKFLVLTGILTTVFTALPAPVSAAGVSPYTEALLQRADEGLSYATNGDFAMQFFEYQQFDWSREVLSAVLQSVDTNLRIVQQTKSLETDSSCLRADLFLVEQKLEEARTTVRGAREDCWKDIQDQEKEGTISEDDKFRLKDEMQKKVDTMNEDLEKVFEKKQEEMQS